ncbi:MAG: glycogen/starch synthase [Spirochaetes bacterium]|nr:glycogen/starch synthase [Spirochaetota bacterium]
MHKLSSTLSSLSRFRLKDENLVADSLVRNEITDAFKDNRCYDFSPDTFIISEFKAGTSADDLTPRFIAIKNSIIDRTSGGNENYRSRLLSDARLSSRLISALLFIHKAIAEGDFTNLYARRFVIIKEKPGSPTIYHISESTTVISHVGTGPEWGEIPSVYLGLHIFDVLVNEQKKNENLLFESFKLLLMIESRAIETGYAHTEVFPPYVSKALNNLVDEVLKYIPAEKIEIEIEKPARISRFTLKNRESLLKLLDARVHGNEMNFDYYKNLKALESLERLARRYKKNRDLVSLREITRLLVSASGHDMHEIRNRANILLERIFSPKEFDAPLASRFINMRKGSKFRLEFKLPAGKIKYFVRFYKNKNPNKISGKNDFNYFDELLKQDNEKAIHFTDIVFDETGHYDFLVFRKKTDASWINLPGTSGRVNVIPDVRGEIILEVFPDIHGHTGIFWKDNGGHPGLVYNEYGEVIRLGSFTDITAHLEYLKKNYYVTSIYLLGVQKRGHNREDWAYGATSPSPFSPMSLTEIEPSLGGDTELINLIKKAHSIGIKIIVDIVPHLNRRSNFPPDYIVKCYNNEGHLVERASTDGRFGSWDDGRLHNYRMLEVWEWLTESTEELIDKYDIDGIRFDSAHAVPIMMKRNNYPYINESKRTHEEMVEGRIIVNDREDGHFITTGYYDSACRDTIAVPFHYYFMLNIERKLREKNKDYFLNIAECYWGHEKYLTRTGIIPYNSALFKICENIIHGKTDIREIYHIYDQYFPSVLPQGTELLGILGNHDERRALNTFGHRGLRAAVGLTMFMSNIIMDYEGSAEGEGWKVFLDNIYVNWNQFENAANRSVYPFYREWYEFQHRTKGNGFLIWANNNMTAAAIIFSDENIWIGVFNFADSNQHVSLQFDNPVLPINDNAFYKILDPVYSHITGANSYYTGMELKTSRLSTTVSFTDRIKLLQVIELEEMGDHYQNFLKDSFVRLCSISDVRHFTSNFAFNEIAKNSTTYDKLTGFLLSLKPLFSTESANSNELLELGIKRALFHITGNGLLKKDIALGYIDLLSAHPDDTLKKIAEYIKFHNRTGAIIFLSAEAEPFSKSGGLANVVYELPRELVKQGEEVYVITGFYKHGGEKALKKMREAIKQYDVKYTGINVNFKIQDTDYTVGVLSGIADGIKYFLLDHHEFFDGLYWGVTSVEKIRKRVAFSRACIEVIIKFDLKPYFTFTNDAYAGLFNSIVRSDHFYANNPAFSMTKFIHIIHNGGWQYFDSFHFHENGFYLFNLFNLPNWKAGEFADPVHPERLNCMAAAVRFADKVITVSPSYAMQIERACDGLERILKNVLGISNAIGKDFRKRVNKKYKESRFFEHYYPRLTEHIKKIHPLKEKIETRYPEITQGIKTINALKDEKRKYILKRLINKMMLQLEKNFKVDPDIMLLCMIHRISEQKGYQLLLEASEGIFSRLGCQAIIGGAVSSGDNRGEEIAHGLYNLSKYYQDRISVSFGFQDVNIPLLSCDYFCMPSMSEPGGISQLEAMACGCFVIARATGGLRDTVIPINIAGHKVQGNGFLFTDFSAWAFYDAVERASGFLKNNSDDTIYKARIIAENSVKFWDVSAKKYIEEMYKFREVIR